MIIKVMPKTGKKQLHTIRSVHLITIESVEGIVYAKLHHGTTTTYIPADNFYLLDDKNNLIEIVGH